MDVLRSSPVVRAGSAPRPFVGWRARGVGVVVLDPSAERSAELVAEIGDRVTTVAGDSNDDDAVGAAISAARSLGVFSIAISATGVVIRSPRLVDGKRSPMPKDVLLANLELHVVGPFNIARLAAAAFAENDPDDDGERGVIVQTASISAFDGQVTMVPYAAAKGAIVAMTLPMARDLAARRCPRVARSRQAAFSHHASRRQICRSC